MKKAKAKTKVKAKNSSKSASKKEIRAKTEQIKQIYKKYLADLEVLKKKQNDIINKFIEQVKQKEIEKAKSELNNL